jgi:hypothetical protein
MSGELKRFGHRNQVTPHMKAWIGKSVIGIGIIHSLFGFVVSRGVIGDLFSEGLFNTVNGEPVREQVFWFLFAGFAWLILGALIDWLERSGRPLPGFFAWALLAMTAVGVFIMPISGLWLFFIPTTGLVLRHTILKKGESGHGLA